MGIDVGFASDGTVEALPADVLQPRQQLESEQAAEGGIRLKQPPVRPADAHAERSEFECRAEAFFAEMQSLFDAFLPADIAGNRGAPDDLPGLAADGADRE